MYRQASQSVLRSAQTSLRTAQPVSRRFASTAREKPRSWKSSAARWGIAIAGIYYYNTHPIFADQTKRVMKFDTDPAQSIEENLPTVDSYTALRKQQQQQNVAPPTTQPVTTDDQGALEEEASQQGAFNPETGEINWDCPCLGGMAHGPCGEEFRSAFSCFVYSEQEPKGLDCIDKFKGMQDCFRAHPEVYAAELEDDDDPELEAELAQEREALQKNVSTPPADQAKPQRRLLDDDSEGTRLPVSPILSPEAPPSKREAASQPSSLPQETRSSQTTPSSESHVQPQGASAASTKDHTASESPKERVEMAKQSTETSSQTFDEDLELMPKAWHDTSDAKVPTEGEKKSKE